MCIFILFYYKRRETHHRQAILHRGSRVIVNAGRNAFYASTASEASALREKEREIGVISKVSHSFMTFM